MKNIYAVQSNTQKSNLYTAHSHFFKVPSTVTTIDKGAHAFERRINVRALAPTAIITRRLNLQELLYFLGYAGQ